MVSIAAAGFVLPLYRLEAGELRAAFGAAAVRGVEVITVAGHDEDEISLAVEACSTALAGDDELPAHLVFASSGDQPGAVTVARALGLDCTTADKAPCHDPLAALAAGVDHVTANHTPALVVWSDAPGGDAYGRSAEVGGAGASALLLSGSGCADVRIEPKSKEKRSEPGVWKRTGRMECAGLPLSLIETLANSKVGDRSFVDGGKGRGVHLTVTSPADVASPSRATAANGIKVDLHHAIRLRAALRPEQDAPMGAYVSDQAYDSSISSRYTLEAQRCSKCAHVQLPPRGVCLRCGEPGGKHMFLERDGEVEAVTVVARGAAPSEFLHQQAMVGEYAVAIISLEAQEGEGVARVVAQLTDCDPGIVKIGDHVEGVFRRLYRQLGTTRYGLKFRPTG